MCQQEMEVEVTDGDEEIMRWERGGAGGDQGRLSCVDCALQAVCAEGNSQ